MPTQIGRSLPRLHSDRPLQGLLWSRTSDSGPMAQCAPSETNKLNLFDLI